MDIIFLFILLSSFATFCLDTHIMYEYAYKIMSFGGDTEINGKVVTGKVVIGDIMIVSFRTYINKGIFVLVVLLHFTYQY